MKSKWYVLLSLPIVLTAAVVSGSHPWLGKSLPAEEAKKRWGSEQFDETKFKNADQKTRAKMAYSVLKAKNLIGLSASEVRSRLGTFDGHYFSESYPTYLIQTAEKAGEESWQLVFILDKDRKTKEVIIHKNCCD